MPDLDRRSLLRLTTLALALVAGAGQGAAQFAPTIAPPGRFSTVVVDVAALHGKGLGAYADLIREALLDETRRAFADRLGGPGPTLVVRITGVSLSMYAGSGGGGRRGGRGGSNDSDYLEGEALLVGRNREVLARYPQLSALPSSSGGAWYDPASERNRTVALASHYAQWLRRTIGG